MTCPVRLDWICHCISNLGSPDLDTKNSPLNTMVIFHPHYHPNGISAPHHSCIPRESGEPSPSIPVIPAMVIFSDEAYPLTVT